MSVRHHGLPRRLSLLAAMLAAAGAGVTHPAMAQMYPTSADFGDSPPGGTGGTRRDFVLPAKSRADSDTLTATLTGRDADQFLIVEKFCVDGPWRCGVHVMFVPTSYGRKMAMLTVTGPGGRIGSATLTGNAVFGCMPLHVSCNYAGNYNGSVAWLERLRAEDVGGPGGRTVQWVKGLVTIKAGIASCNGVVADTARSPDGESIFAGTLTGDGMGIVEFGTGTDDDPNQEWYQITVVCPLPGGTLTNKSYRTGEVTETRRAKVPAEMGHGDVSTRKLPDSSKATAKVIRGSQVEVPPEVDPLNKVTGVFAISWDLARLDQPLPPLLQPPPPDTKDPDPPPGRSLRLLGIRIRYEPMPSGVRGAGQR